MVSERATSAARGVRRRRRPATVAAEAAAAAESTFGFGPRFVDGQRAAAHLERFSSVAAFCASSSVDISTNANPRARPVAASRMTRTDSTVPALLEQLL